MSAITTITFDFWNTLCVPDNDRYREARLAAVRDAFASHDIEVSDDDVAGAFVGLFETFNEKWGANTQFVARDAAAMVIDRLAPDSSDDVRETVVSLFESAPGETVPRLAENVADVLASLDEAGIRLGIICDVGMTPSPVLREYLDRHGILHRFDHWSFSDEVGVYKPHAAIFEHALDGLGATPETTAHIGDLRRTDVAGALAMGMTSVRYRGAHDDTGDIGDVDELVEAHHVIDDHRQLPGVLGLDVAGS
jgi:putative hydrolase of the HAD superfamily